MTQDTIADARIVISIEGIEKGHHNITYRGIKCTKAPFDYVLYQMIVHSLKPDLIIEIGANEGGSAFYLADLLEHNGKGVIHTIDIEDRIAPEVKENKRIQFFGNGWEGYDTALASDFETVLVIEDSSHTYENTLGVMHKFAPLVTPGSYLIVEDGIVEVLGVAGQFNGGPVKAIKEFLQATDNFINDVYWTDFFGKNATFNTIGYLKKVK